MWIAIVSNGIEIREFGLDEQKRWCADMLNDLLSFLFASLLNRIDSTVCIFPLYTFSSIDRKKEFVRNAYTVIDIYGI